MYTRCVIMMCEIMWHVYNVMIIMMCKKQNPNKTWDVTFLPGWGEKFAVPPPILPQHSCPLPVLQPTDTPWSHNAMNTWQYGHTIPLDVFKNMCNKNQHSSRNLLPCDSLTLLYWVYSVTQLFNHQAVKQSYNLQKNKRLHISMSAKITRG